MSSLVALLRTSRSSWRQKSADIAGRLAKDSLPPALLGLRLCGHSEHLDL